MAPVISVGADIRTVDRGADAGRRQVGLRDLLINEFLSEHVRYFASAAEDGWQHRPRREVAWERDVSDQVTDGEASCDPLPQVGQVLTGIVAGEVA
jgi:hypothetical protein